VFEKVFIQTVRQCVEAGLVEGSKIHVDSSLVAANASKDSVSKSSPELIAAYKQAYAAQESKLEDTTTPEHYEAVNDRMISTTDPDAALMRKGGGGTRPRYHHHRAIDDAHGVITAVETTPGSIAENKKLMDLVEQHQSNTRQKVETVVGESKYGTAENLAAWVEAGLRPHLGEIELGRKMARSVAARRDRRRRQHLMEGSFAQAANEHGFKRSRWRRLWRQEIQDWLIATVQNVKILLKATERRLLVRVGLGSLAEIICANMLWATRPPDASPAKIIKKLILLLNTYKIM
jgi:hypothetical protein